jgi:putative peptide zinc metalloprotease protein
VSTNAQGEAIAVLFTFCAKRKQQTEIYMPAEMLESDLERRKQVKLRLRPDLEIAPHKYEGRTYFIVKDPVSLRYYRFKEQEHFLLRLMDGQHTLDDAQKAFEREFRPDRLTLEDLEGFGHQLLTVGLAQNDAPHAGKQLWDRRKKRLRREWLAVFTNILYIKLPLFDPDRLLTWMMPFTRWIFTFGNAVVSLGLMLAAIMLVATHFEMFRDKLPGYQEFFSFKTVGYLWLALGVVKVIHEFGHGLSCKAFGGEVHEMGALLLCLSPCLYCNVSDAWTMPNKWHRIIISFAGIYVELIIASIATFIWWNSPGQPFINNLSLSLMIVCSVSTIVFNGNPLMRFDGYYVLADWMEIPNLRDRCNKYLKNLSLEHFLGVEVPPEQYMALSRKILFILYAVVSYVYRWVVTFSILYFLSMFLKPYKLGAVSGLLAIAALASMIGWPAWRVFDNWKKRGRFPDMKPERVRLTVGVSAVLLAMFFFLPLPVSRIRETALVQEQPFAAERVFVPTSGGILDSLAVQNGQKVQKGEVLGRFRNVELKNQLDEAASQVEIFTVQIAALSEQMNKTTDTAEQGKIGREIVKAKGDRALNAERIPTLEQMLRDMEIRSPRAGVVMGLPTVDDIGKTFELDPEKPFCTIGDPAELRVLVPVSTADYRLLQEDLAIRRSEKSDIAVTIRVHGHGGRTWEGKVAQMPESEAKSVPASLTTKYGGPLAFKPDPLKPGAFIPISQQYLVGIQLEEPDASLCPGTLAQVKIHCRWKSCAWWVWRAISTTFDIGLM